MATLAPISLVCCLIVLIGVNSGADGNSSEVRAFGSPSLEMMIAQLKKSKPLSARGRIAGRHPQSVLVVPQPTLKPQIADILPNLTKRHGSKHPNRSKNGVKVNGTRLRHQHPQLSKKQGQLISSGGGYSSDGSSDGGYSSDSSEEDDSYESEEDSEEPEESTPNPKKARKRKPVSGSLVADPPPAFKSMKLKDHPTNFLNLVGTDFQPYRLVNIFLVLIFMMYMLVTQGYMMWVYGLSFRGGQSIIQGIPGFHFLQTSLANTQAALSSSSASNTLGWLGLLAGAPFKIIDSGVWENLREVAVDLVDETFLFLEEAIPEAGNATLPNYFDEFLDGAQTFLDNY